MSEEKSPATPAEPQVTQEQALKLMQTGQLFATLAADPKTRTQVLGLIKQAKPDLYIPELEVQGEVDKTVAARVKPYEEKTEALSKELAELKGAISRQAWAAKAGLSEDEAVEVEKVAEEAGITKGETALEYWTMKQRLGTPRATPASKAGEEYLTKIRKVNPRDPQAGQRLKALAIEEGMRIQRETRGRRAG